MISNNPNNNSASANLRIGSTSLILLIIFVSLIVHSILVGNESWNFILPVVSNLFVGGSVLIIFLLRASFEKDRRKYIKIVRLYSTILLVWFAIVSILYLLPHLL